MKGVGLGPIPHDPRRKLPRHHTDVVTCPLGTVIDLSGSGMRLRADKRCPLKIGQCIPLKLATPNGSIKVNAKVVWKKNKGLLGSKGTELGLDFLGITPAQTIALATIARFGFVAPSKMRHGKSKADAADNKQDQNQAHQTQSSPEQIEANLVMAEYYQRLGVAPGATFAEVKTAFHTVARTCHPDVAPGPDSAKKFTEVREAYDLLREHLKQAG